MTPIEQLQHDNASLRLQMAHQAAAHEEEVIGFGRRIRRLEKVIQDVSDFIGRQNCDFDCNSQSEGVYAASPGWTPYCDCWKKEALKLSAAREDEPI